MLVFGKGHSLGKKLIRYDIRILHLNHFMIRYDIRTWRIVISIDWIHNQDLVIYSQDPDNSDKLGQIWNLKGYLSLIKVELSYCSNKLKKLN